MLSRLLSFFGYTQTPPPEEFKERIFNVINARHSHDDQATLEESKSQLISLLKEAKQKHYDLNTHEKNGYTFIHHVILRANPSNETLCIELLELLHQNGCNINTAGLDRYQTPPIIMACRRSMTGTVTWLLEHGANSLCTDFKDGRPYQTPGEYIENAIAVVVDRNVDRNEDERIKRLIAIHALLIKYELKEKGQTTIYSLQKCGPTPKP
jgi:ankyrin repeat protein